MGRSDNLYAIARNGKRTLHPLSEIYGKCIELSVGLESVLYLFPEKGLIVKKAIGDNKDKIIREAKWIRDLPGELRKNFPQIISVDHENDSYVMKAYPYEPVSTLLIDKKITAEQAFNFWIDSYMLFMSYRKQYERPAPNGFEKELLSKAQKRLEGVKNESKFFKELFEYEYLNIDGSVYLNANYALQEIEKLMELDDSYILTPPFLTLMHLDLQISNIIVNDTPILLDPTGAFLGDPLYDIMKGVHSIDYEYINRSYISANETLKGPVGNHFEICLKKNNDRDNRVFEFIGCFEKLVTNPGLHALDEIIRNHWSLRFWYQYATTMLGGTLFLLRSDLPGKVIKSQTRYVISTIYINLFLNKYADYLCSIGVDSMKNGVIRTENKYKDANLSELSAIIITLDQIRKNKA